MDPLHPRVPIQPAPPVPPDYTRVQRIERDQQRESEPDWQRPSDQGSDDEQRDEDLQDEYEPEWSETAGAETYNDHGELTDGPGPSGSTAGARRPYNPRLQGERRARPRSTDDPEDQEPGPHIDIIA